MRARKRFGQHFLTDAGVLERIYQAVKPEAADKLLEIGPGRGSLTACLYGETQEYLAVEIDRDLIAGLTRRFPDMELVNADILALDLAAVLSGKWRVVGNLPYNISSPLLVKLYADLEHIKDMHFMFQRELGERLSANPGSKDWGRLSVVTQYHCQVEPLFDVDPWAFAPPPKVYSQVVRLTPRAHKPEVDLEQLNVVLRTAFSARRKRISNALKSFELDWERLGVRADARPDQLSVAEYVAIANADVNAP